MTVTVIEAGSRKVSRAVEVPVPVGEIFAIVADPRRHPELDGSGTVLDTVTGPQRLTAGARFSVKMKQRGVPYRITSRVTDFDEGRVVEWQHPMGHRWRWELTPPSEMFWTVPGLPASWLPRPVSLTPAVAPGDTATGRRKENARDRSPDRRARRPSRDIG